jgi:uncharacterized protein
MLLLLASPVMALQGHIKLLAVQEDTREGNVADLFLEIIPGRGRVFIETFPLTKIDTQISTRFAKEVACSLLDANCNKYDFIYTIRSRAYIIGGPSAGAAISVLTMSLLEGFTPNQNIALTGTINSGGYIGPVSGIKEKIKAGAEENLETILIPSGTRFFENKTETENGTIISNVTIDLVKYGEELGIEVKEIIDIEDALFEFTGISKKSVDGNLELTDEYTKVMQLLSEKLCNRTKDIQKKFLEANPKVLPNEAMVELEKRSINLTERAEIEKAKQNYYSAASFCFGANYQYRRLYFETINLSDTQIVNEAKQLKSTLEDIKKKIDKNELKTVTDLQTFLIVKDRINEATQNVETIIEKNDSSSDKLAYAMERAYSAVSWSNFFNKGNQKVTLNEEIVKESCIKKLAEAEERLQYTTIFLTSGLESIKKEIENAQADLHNNQFALCLFKSSKAKSASDVILNNIGVQQKQIPKVIENKLGIVKKSIIRETKKGIFPIMGYSYYEYASSLSKYDPLSSLVYIEYATELSNFDMYFSNGKEKEWNIGTAFITQNELERFDKILGKGYLEIKDPRLVLIIGIIVGILSSVVAIICYDIYKLKKKKNKKSKKRKRKS